MNEEIQWQKSSFSGANGEACVEVAHMGDDIVMRESDDPGQILTTTRERLHAFVLGVKAGEFNPPRS